MAYKCAHCAGAPMCPETYPAKAAPFGAWLCTRREGHKGPHVAMNPAHEIKATWNRRRLSPSKAPRGRAGKGD
jgi:hypothetical protein